MAWNHELRTPNSKVQSPKSKVQSHEALYTDLLIRIKNAEAARKPNLKVPYSNLDFSVASILARHHFIKQVEKKGRGPKRVMEITLQGSKRQIDGMKFISKSSRRIYVGYKDLFTVRRGFGIAILSTPMGVIDSKEAKKNKVGGELLFEIW